MSKLYLKVNSDARKKELTSRGHQEIKGKVLYNFSGGNSEENQVFDFTVNHSKIFIDLIINLGPGKNHSQVIFRTFQDGKTQVIHAPKSGGKSES